VFGETVDFLQVGVFGNRRVFRQVGGRRPMGCLPGKQLPAAVFDGGE